ncbi:hypothetical protein GUY59_11190, partial [Nonomuraea sp. K271]|nr:hypothetical protein [Nonomuraea sp. K271]
PPDGTSVTPAGPESPTPGDTPGDTFDARPATGQGEAGEVPRPRDGDAGGQSDGTGPRHEAPGRQDRTTTRPRGEDGEHGDDTGPRD